MLPKFLHGREKFKSKSSSGYTLIELLIVIVTMAMLFGLGVASYRDYQRRQTHQAIVRQISSDLRLAQEWANAGKKPNHVNCNSPAVLIGYYFRRKTANQYRVEAYCSGGASVPLKTESLSSGFSLVTPPTPNPLLFKTVGGGTNIDASSTWVLNIKNQTTGDVLSVTVTPGGEIK